jgi:hypothetical protein
MPRDTLANWRFETSKNGRELIVPHAAIEQAVVEQH